MVASTINLHYDSLSRRFLGLPRVAQHSSFTHVFVEITVASFILAYSRSFSFSLFFLKKKYISFFSFQSTPLVIVVSKPSLSQSLVKISTLQISLSLSLSQ